MQLFTFEQVNVRVIFKDDSPWWVAADVCEVLGLSNPSVAVAALDDDERSKFNLGRQGEGWFLTENGLYEVLMQSRKPIAKQFKKGVKTILREIRKTGGYIATTQDDSPELIMARALQVAQSTIDRHKQMLQQANERITIQEQEIKKAAPKVQYVDNVLQSVNTYTSTQMSKELGLREAEQLHKILRERGVMFKQSGQWLLTAKYCGCNYTKPRTHSFTRNDGSTGTSTTTVWTEKGRAFLHTLLGA